MLNVDGDWETGMGRWDSAHEDDGDWTVGNGTPVMVSDLDYWYCTRASIAMIVSFHGGNLSQDRISYEEYGGAAQWGDLGHGKGLWPNEKATRGSGKNIFDWAMYGAEVTSSRGKPTFDQVKAWIDDNRPALIVENINNSLNSPKHSVVLDGYRDWPGHKLAHRVDPGTATAGWISWSTWNVSEYHVAPVGVHLVQTRIMMVMVSSTRLTIAMEMGFATSTSGSALQEATTTLIPAILTRMGTACQTRMTCGSTPSMTQEPILAIQTLTSTTSSRRSIRTAITEVPSMVAKTPITMASSIRESPAASIRHRKMSPRTCHPQFHRTTNFWFILFPWMSVGPR